MAIETATIGTTHQISAANALDEEWIVADLLNISEKCFMGAL